MSLDNEFKCTLVSKPSNKLMTKMINKDETGKLIKDAGPCKMLNGTGEILVGAGLSKFAESLKAVPKNTALVHGIPKEHLDLKPEQRFSIVARRQKDKGAKGITRTRDNFYYPASGALTMFDYDHDESQLYYSHEDFMTTISEVIPEFSEVEKVINFSASSYIYDVTGNKLSGDTPGYHIYFIVKDGSDLKRFAKVLEKRLWLAGYGWIMISKSGSLLVRCLIDTAIYSPERLDFIAPAHCGPGLEQRKPDPIHIEGSILDTRCVSDLTAQEEKQYTDMVEQAKALVKPQAEAKKKQYVEDGADVLVKERENSSTPISKAEAREVMAGRIKQELNYNDSLYFDQLGTVKVQDVLRNLEKYDECSMKDPLEPEEGQNKAMFFANRDKDRLPIIHSFLHGGQTYTFSNKKSFIQVITQLEYLLKANGEVELTSEQWFDVLYNANFEKIDLNRALEYLVDADVGTKRDLNRIYKEMAEAKDIEKKKRELERKSQGRVCIETDPANLIRTISDVEKAILENPGGLQYFNFGGQLSYVYDQGVQGGNGQSSQYPEIRSYTRDNLPLKIDEVAYFSKMQEKGPKSISPPKDVINAMLDNPYSKAPSIEGMVCHPIILPDGTIVDKSGIDERSNVLLNLGEQQFKPVPEHPELEAAKGSVKFLYDTFFKEFSYKDTPVDLKDGYQLLMVVSIAMLLTCLVRKVIDLAPGFLVNANIQGSGKTTLVRICNIILTGFDMSVTSFSRSPEEIEKQILAMLKRCPLMLCFDNIWDGAELRDQTISKVMTSVSYTGRILGQTKEMTVPTKTVFIMTGNNVSFSSDLVRRFLIISLSSDTDRPENKVYKNPDIMQHCLKNKQDALHACLTIIKAYIDSGSPIDSTKIPSSGFSQWDQMVRFPLLWATGIDILASVNLSREQSTEQQSFQGLIDGIFSLYHRNPFTAKRLHGCLLAHERDQHRTFALGSYDVGKQDEFSEAYNLIDEIITHVTNIAPGGWENFRGFVHIFKKLKDRVISGKKLIYKTNSSGNNGRYYIELVDPVLIAAEEARIAGKEPPVSID